MAELKGCTSIRKQHHPTNHKKSNADHKKILIGGPLNKLIEKLGLVYHNVFAIFPCVVHAEIAYFRAVIMRFFVSMELADRAEGETCQPHEHKKPHDDSPDNIFRSDFQVYEFGKCAIPIRRREKANSAEK